MKHLGRGDGTAALSRFVKSLIAPGNPQDVMETVCERVVVPVVIVIVTVAVAVIGIATSTETGQPPSSCALTLM